ncbi:MAG: ABC transporter ATP-binding protein [Chloroflexi bacterium]|nr:ABC transporter ATP-binding protein [Chloroflexota bacterium]
MGPMRFDLAGADKRKFDPKLLFRALGFMAPYKIALAGSILAVLAVTASDLAGPALLRRAIDRDLAAGSWSGLVSTLLLYLFTILLNSAMQSGQRYITGWLGQQVILDLRAAAFDHLQTLSLRFYDDHEMGDIISRITNDIDLLNELLSNGLVTLVNTIVSLGGVIIVMIAMDARLSFLAFSVMPLLFIVTTVFRKWVGAAYRATREKIAAVTAHIEEAVSGVRIIQAFAQEDRDMSAFKVVNAASRDVNLEAAAVRSIYFPMIDVTGSLGMAIVIFFGGAAILRGDLSVGVMVAFISYLMRFFQPIRNLSVLYDSVLAAMAAAERIFELLDTQPEIQNPPNPIILPRIEGLVEFKDVHFHYKPEQPVLKGVNLVARPGEMIAIVGATGAGKTTTISLLTRFYDVTGGAICIDGHDLRELDLAMLRTQIGVVLQAGFLFSDTVRENIRYGRLDATDEEIEEAAKIVGAHEFIMRLSDGYDTQVRERGEKLSMGERQLICLARALIANPRILILDEATSSIDPYTELIIQRALLKLFEDRTSIVIAHRLSTVRRANRIYVFDQGEVVEVGTHEELLAQGGLYAKLHAMQFRDREVTEEEEEALAVPRRGFGGGGGMGGEMMPTI